MFGRRILAGRALNIEPRYGAIALEAAAIAGGEAIDVYLYIEVESGAAFGAVYKEEGNVVRYFDPSDALYDLAFEAWEAEPEEQRWLILEYGSRDGNFEMQFAYPDEVDSDGFASDRRHAALARRFGDKPVIYPPIPDDNVGRCFWHR